jgi:NAD(P)-dependent dehydrogenase (short-subunit alcohol dehydrogenase family)
VSSDLSVKPKELNDSVVLISGGTSGVGLAAAKQFASAGARKIVLVGRNEARGEDARGQLLSDYPKAQVEYFQADANDPAQAERTCEFARATFGAIDVMVNSTAANYVPKLLHNTPTENIASILTQQALAPMHMSRAVLPFMREQKGGVIINVASDAAKVPTPGESVIGAAMAAIVVFTRTLAIEAKRDGIRANVLTPSLISGTTVYDRVMDDPFSAKLFANAAKLASLGVAEPDDLAALIVFLGSPAAARLTGQAISVNGGISAA